MTNATGGRGPRVKNIFLTGPPNSGKTTVIKKVLSCLKRPGRGFHTQEIKRDGRRVGFMMVTTDGKEGLLAHEEIESAFSVRRYGVSIENIAHIAVPSIITKFDEEIIILDEIGKMECYSERFREAALKALDSKNIVLGTIAVGGDTFIREIKARNDVKLYEVTLENRDRLPRVLIEEMESLGCG
ncbi:MAG: nucleoside-triphosphatase [Pseudomonadota bacterium]